MVQIQSFSNLDIIEEAKNSIIDFLELCRLYDNDFSSCLLEEIDKKKANELIRRTINDIINLSKSIENGKLDYNEENFYSFLKEVINLNTEFHTNNQVQSSVDKELQNRLFTNIKILNDNIEKWNSKYPGQHIMNIKEAKDRSNKNLSEGLKYFGY